MIDDDAHAIEICVQSFYGAFDNRGTRRPAVDELHQMFAPDARVTCVKADRMDAWSVDEFIAPRAVMLADGTLTEFHEWSIQSRVDVFGEIASHASSYLKSGVLNGTPYRGGGDKLIQFIKVDDHWMIHSILWRDMP